MEIERVKGPIPTELCKSCMAGHQELKISRMPMPKVIGFMGRLHVDIEGPLPVTCSGFDIFHLSKMISEKYSLCCQ